MTATATYTGRRCHPRRSIDSYASTGILGMTERLDWTPFLERAARIAASYSTPVTLRQLFYRLVAAGLLPNTQLAYKTLAAGQADRLAGSRVRRPPWPAGPGGAGRAGPRRPPGALPGGDRPPLRRVRLRCSLGARGPGA